MCGNIPADILKASVNIDLGFLTDIIYKSFGDGEFQVYWNIRKSSHCSRRKVMLINENYRPVSFLSLMPKIFEKQVNSKLALLVTCFRKNTLCLSLSLSVSVSLSLSLSLSVSLCLSLSHSVSLSVSVSVSLCLCLSLALSLSPSLPLSLSPSLPLSLSNRFCALHGFIKKHSIKLIIAFWFIS